jgi:hypothetical protein
MRRTSAWPRRFLVQRLGAEDLLDGAHHRDLRVVGVDDLAVLGPRADDLYRRTVAVDVVGTVLAVVLDHEDRGILPERRVMARDGPQTTLERAHVDLVVTVPLSHGSRAGGAGWSGTRGLR